LGGDKNSQHLYGSVGMMVIKKGPQKSNASATLVPQGLARKIYVLDTNVLVHDPLAMFSFEGVYVGIPSIVLEELDHFKKEGTDRGRNTRDIIRQLDSLRELGSLRDGVALGNGATLMVLFPENTIPNFPFQLKVEDNQILLTALALKNRGWDVKFISKDINARVKADALGIEAQDYLKEFVTQEEFYQGWLTVSVPAVQLKNDAPPVLNDLVEKKLLTVNQFVLLESQHNQYNYRLFRYLGDKKFKGVNPPNLKWPLKPRNAQQAMALDLLLDDQIQLITLVGPAGTGKTFLALLAGLYKVMVEDVYQKMLISRPVIPLGRDVGYLPGELKEKLYNWMLPIYDNMEFITHAVNLEKHEEELHTPYEARRSKDKKKHPHHNRRPEGLMSLDELINRGKMSLEAITYMRGRSIPYQFILIDESQNLNPHEIKTIITRAGEGSKIILAGDPFQIDSPYLDFSSNGLVVAAERFKGQKLFGSVYLPVSERSQLSKLAGELL
jgi:PhoH-like ATPase